MKILMVTPYYYPSIGGVQNYVKNISEGLIKRHKWEIVVVTTNHNENKYTEEITNGIKIYRLPYWLKISNTPINPLWLFNLLNIIRKEHPDIINAHSPVPFMSDIASVAAGNIPFITTYHSGRMIKETSTLNPLIFLYETFLLKLLFIRSKKIICYSPNYIKRNLIRYKEKVKYISPGVDINMFKPSKRKTTNDILYIGRIEKNSDWKGIKYLLQAVSIIKKYNQNISLRLVGSGDRIDYFKKYSKLLGINSNVSFIEAKVGVDLVQEYQKSKLLVLPSITESESFGIVLIEAMACKKPVIGTNIGGISYVIDDKKNGFLVEPKNSSKLAGAIKKILSNRILCKKMALNGYEKVIKGFSWDKQINKTKILFDEALI